MPDVVSRKAEKPPRRVWTPLERARALAFLRSNGGNARRTARQLGIPPRTLRDWASAPEKAAPAALRAEQEQALEDAVTQIALDLLEGLKDPARIERILQKPAQAMTVAAIAIDKRNVLLGKPTTIEQRVVSYVEPGALRRAALQVLDGGRDAAGG